MNELTGEVKEPFTWIFSEVKGRNDGRCEHDAFRCETSLSRDQRNTEKCNQGVMYLFRRRASGGWNRDLYSFCMNFSRCGSHSLSGDVGRYTGTDVRCQTGRYARSNTRFDVSRSDC